MKLIYPETVDKEVFKAVKPVLLAFLKSDGKFAERIKTLHSISRGTDEWLKVCLGDTYYLESFFNLFQFYGTPFYLLYFEGFELNRYFGHAEEEDLKRFVFLSLPENMTIKAHG